MRYHVKFYNVAGNKIAEHESFFDSRVEEGGATVFTYIESLVARFRAKDPRIVRFTIDVTL